MALSESASSASWTILDLLSRMLKRLLVVVSLRSEAER